MTGRFRLPDWLLAHDPALSRVRMGARVTLTILISIATLAAFHVLVMPLPPVTYGLAIILSIEGGVAVRDASPAEQFKTRLWGCLVSLCAVATATLLEGHRFVSDFVFLMVILAATLARVYGPRGFALGMFAFTSYFIGAFLKPGLADLPLAAIGLVMAMAMGHLVRTFVVPDDRRRDLLQALVAVQGRSGAILAKLALLSSAGRWSEEDRAELQALEERLKEVTLMAESLLPVAGQGRVDGAAKEGEEDPAVSIAMKIFDVHLAAESAIVLSLESLPPADLLDAVRNGDGARVKRHAELIEGQDHRPATESIRALIWLHEARRSLGDEIAAAQMHGFPSFAPSPSLAAIRPDISLKNPVVRAALQITIASGLAMVFGLMLSRDRWFWAVLTAFLIFTNTKSRGDAAVRALQRSIGTVLGIAIGLGLATLLSGQPIPAVALALCCIFLAFYYLQVSYAVMSFFISIVICLVYGIIGQLTFDLLLLRIEETLIGAVAGTVVAFLVFPSPTRATVDGALSRWYAAMQALLDAARKGEGGFRLIELSRQLDAAYRELTLAARPLGSAWSVVTRPGRIRRTLAVFLASTYWARIFARNISASQEPPDGEVLEAIDSTLQTVKAVSGRGAECFFIPRKRRHAGDRHLPIFRDGSRLGIEMIGNLLERLYPQR